MAGDGMFPEKGVSVLTLCLCLWHKIIRCLWRGTFSGEFHLHHHPAYGTIADSLRVAKGREGLLTGGGVLGLSFIVSTWLTCVTGGQAWFWMMLFLPGIMLNDSHWNWRSSFWEPTMKGSYLSQVSPLPLSSWGIHDTDKPVTSGRTGRRIKLRWECGC